ncbi:cell wall-binding protein [Clostridium beijerinckii]|uniref:Cell wall-binding protein n=2 Tax=Clostridium beijerinckii TaxID=1520 RepID=A0A0B5QXQ3_CLOBE|nr:cadherin-like beta sandwich domain-containing protein [Clostridium beijerinckii]AJH01759.1 cell wall-binding protein [Clostridium beijerinckii]
MSKIKKRFIALIVVFTSIISLIPLGFNSEVAKADDIPAEATASRVNLDGTMTPLPSRIDSNTQEEIHTANSLEDNFDISLKNIQKTQAELIQQAKDSKSSITGVTKQEIVVKAINEAILINDDGTANADGQNAVAGMGITLSYSNSTGNGGPTPVENDSERIGVKITGLPAGVNKIKYAVKITTLSIIYKETKNSDGTVTQDATPDPAGEKTVTKYEKTITIENGKDYATNQISEMTFKAYVGDADAFNDKDEILDATKNENNTVPFLYSTTVTPDPNMKLRYNFDVPDSLSALKYIMTFGDMINLDKGVELYKNGIRAVDGSFSLNGQKLSGDLSNRSKSDLIVIKVNSVTNDSSSTVKIAKAYAVEIRYNKLDAEKDYSLKNAGITKLDFNDDDDVKAYIGKAFTVTKTTSGFSEYKGKIYVDSRAGMISINPTLIRSQSSNNVAYTVTNNYKDSSGKTKTEQSQLKNGKQYVNFDTSSDYNQIQIDAYEGKDGNITNSSQILARYLLDVVVINNDNNFTMNLEFSKTTDSNSDVVLTQPGVTKANNGEVSFTSSRRSYDLYYGSPNANSVIVSFTGHQSDKHEYIKVFFADDVNSTNLEEATESVNNLPDSDLLRSTSLNVNIAHSRKKMVVQAYYDKVEIKKDENGQNVKVKTGTYTVGDSYVFYLPENFTGEVTPDPGASSSNASLNSLKISGYTLTDGDGNSGFSSDKLDYKTTVAKEDTTEKITAIAQDDNVKSIIASINGNDATYDLTSGEANEIPLNTNGNTTITIVVTAQDGKTSKTYSIVIKNNSKGSNANLKNVILSQGDYTFDPKEDITKVRVDQNVSKINVTPVAEDSKSTISVNGEEYSDSAISVSLKGAQKTEIDIEVISEDGKETKTYTLEVYRVDSSDWDNDDNNNDSGNDDDQFYDDYNDCWVDLTKYDEWGTVNGKPVYFDKKSRQVKNAWVSTGGKYYYLNNLGYRASGWKVDDKTGQTYYLDPTTGEMRKGWMNLNNSWYYLGLNGVMKKGWLNLNGKWYYFTPNGQMVVNQSMYIDDGVYKFRQDGAMY